MVESGRWRPCRGASRSSSSRRDRPATWPAATATTWAGAHRGTPKAFRTACPTTSSRPHIAQHIAASPDEVVRFSWHGGEPTVLGVDYFRKAVATERRLLPPGRSVANGLQTNGTLLDDDWGRFLADEGFSVGLSLDGPREFHDRLSPDPRRPAGLRRDDAGLRGPAPARRPDRRPLRRRRPQRRPAPRGLRLLPGDRRRVRDLPAARRARGPARPAASATIPCRPKPGASSSAPSSTSGWSATSGASRSRSSRKRPGRLSARSTRSASSGRFAATSPSSSATAASISCDHYVDAAHRLGNIRETPLAALLESPAQRAFGRAKLETLPGTCRACAVLDMCHGECPQNRLAIAPGGEPGLNYLCPGYRRFFTHVRPFVDAVAAAWRRRSR
ncbi:MAG: SPASM domain-containing protein [Desulfobacterales bacterium]|nr:SPASM domain-containing protein [Desulfobacterales bacterium]